MENEGFNLVLKLAKTRTCMTVNVDYSSYAT